MKKGYTKVLLILDRSGSMSNIQKEMVDGINEYIDGLKKQEGKCDVFAVQFDTGGANQGREDWYQVLFDKPLNEVPTLTTDVYQPRSGTPLLDAIGKTIDEQGHILKVMKEEDRPEHVIVLIITDGQENASTRYGSATNKRRVADMIKHQQEVYKWIFTFMGADHDAVLAAEELHIPSSLTMNYYKSQRGMNATVSSNAMFANMVRSGSSVPKAANVSYSADTKLAAMDGHTATVTTPNPVANTFVISGNWGGSAKEDE